MRFYNPGKELSKGESHPSTVLVDGKACIRVPPGYSNSGRNYPYTPGTVTVALQGEAFHIVPPGEWVSVNDVSEGIATDRRRAAIKAIAPSLLTEEEAAVYLAAQKSPTQNKPPDANARR